MGGGDGVEGLGGEVCGKKGGGGGGGCYIKRCNQCSLTIEMPLNDTTLSNTTHEKQIVQRYDSGVTLGD